MLLVLEDYHFLALISLSGHFYYKEVDLDAIIFRSYHIGFVLLTFSEL